jgi:hypothetical protein
MGWNTGSCLFHNRKLLKERMQSTAPFRSFVLNARPYEGNGAPLRRAVLSRFAGCT